MDKDLRRLYVRVSEPDDERWDNCKPADESEMTFIGARVTVCELLREIYQKTDDPEIRMKCRMATTLAKKMAGMITEYRGKNWGRSVYPWNPLRRHGRYMAKYDK